MLALKLTLLLCLLVVSYADDPNAEPNPIDDDEDFPEPASESPEPASEGAADKDDPSTGADGDADPTESANPDETVEEETVDEPPPLVLECDSTMLQQHLKTWSVDCVALWLDNLGYRKHQTLFMDKEVDGAALQSMNLLKLIALGVPGPDSTEDDDADPIMKGIKDLRAQDEDAHGIPFFSILLWALPFIGIYKYLESKYAKQFKKMGRKLDKAKSKAVPPKPKATHEEMQEDWLPNHVKPKSKKPKSVKAQ